MRMVTTIGAFQLAKYDIESQQRVCSVEIVLAESGLNEADRNVWNDIMANSQAINARDVNDKFGE